MAANFVSSFTTGLQNNTTAPLVASTDPADAATGVPLNQRISATFSTAMNPATISAAGTFTVAVAGGGPAVVGTVSYAGRTAVFTPTANLVAGDTYTATITTAATDLTGKTGLADLVPIARAATVAIGNDTGVSHIAAAGANGFLCAKLNEAEALVDAGLTDVFIANQIVGPLKLRRLAELARRSQLRVCVDDAALAVRGDDGDA